MWEADSSDDYNEQFEPLPEHRQSHNWWEIPIPEKKKLGLPVD